MEVAEDGQLGFEELASDSSPESDELISELKMSEAEIQRHLAIASLEGLPGNIDAGRQAIDRVFKTFNGDGGPEFVGTKRKPDDDFIIDASGNAVAESEVFKEKEQSALPFFKELSQLAGHLRNIRHYPPQVRKAIWKILMSMLKKITDYTQRPKQ